MIMKPLPTLFAAFLLAGATAQGAIYSFSYNSGFQDGGAIPDANTTGWTDTRTISGVGSVLNSITVIINVSGGANGDLYAFLSYNGTLVPLLNRVGTGSVDPIQNLFGFSTAGFDNVRLNDAGSSNIHDVEVPASSPAYYHPDGGSLNAAFGTGDLNGAWTLFFADKASAGGSGPSTVVSWGLEITAVPEPVNLALGLLGGLSLVVGATHKRQQLRAQLRRWRTAFTHWVDAV